MKIILGRCAPATPNCKGWSGKAELGSSWVNKGVWELIHPDLMPRRGRFGALQQQRERKGLSPGKIGGAGRWGLGSSRKHWDVSRVYF